MSAVADAFLRLTGRAPAGVWSAPGRVNLIGEHIDYSGGVVLPFALEQRTYVAAASRTDGQVVLRSVQHGSSLAAPITAAVSTLDTDAVTGWAAYAAGVIWALRKHFGSDVLCDGIDVVIDGHVPAGSGLSSSAALECAMALAGAGVAGITGSAFELAQLAQTAENDYVGVPCGLMDQAASMLCTERHLLAFDAASHAAVQVPFDPGAVGPALMLITTRATRELRSGEYAARRLAVEAAAAALEVPSLRHSSRDAIAGLADPVVRRRAQHVVDEMRRVDSALAAIGSSDWAGLGRCLVESHASLRDLFDVSNRELDLAVDAALAAGALGARMTGAGFGGSVIALAESPHAVADQVARAFGSAKLDRPDVRTVVPAAGARREV